MLTRYRVLSLETLATVVCTENLNPNVMMVKSAKHWA
jgi:hypothetical protein